MPLKHPIRCLSAGFNHAGSRPVAQEIRLSPSCSAASGQRHRDEGGSRDDPSGRVPATWLMAPVPGVTRRGTGQGAPRSLSGRHSSGCGAGCRRRPAHVPPVHSSPRARPARRVPSWTAWAGRAAWRSREGVEGRFPSVGSGAAFAPVADQAVAVDVPAGDVAYAEVEVLDRGIVVG